MEPHDEVWLMSLAKMEGEALLLTSEDNDAFSIGLV